ncbi:MAG: twin-arginine translocase subunit TatB [Proteobacteria bacterium]|nr:twin-arginine translocase subunit TatB [Pseudomonadota bacterium]
MLGLGFGEIFLLGVLLIVVVGPERLPHLIRGAGRMYGQVRRASDELRRAFVLEADRVDADERFQELEKRRNQALEARRRAAEDNPGAVAQPSILSEPPPAATAEEDAEVTA